MQLEGLFTLVGFFVSKVKKMSERIKLLNIELEKNNKDLEELTLRDHLTSLHNRRYINEIVFELASNFLNRLTIPEAKMRDMKIVDQVIAVFMVDIDNFKVINDTYGHAAGDQVLVEISDRLKRSVRFDDIIARWGGEEFLVVCPATKKEYIELIIKKILAGVRQDKYTLSESEQCEVTVSIGCSYYPLLEDLPDALSFEQVIQVCDAALYHAKENGRNQASYVVPMHETLGARLEHGLGPVHALIHDSSLFSIKTYL